MCLDVCVPRCTLKVRRLLVGMDSLLLPCGFWHSNQVFRAMALIQTLIFLKNRFLGTGEMAQRLTLTAFTEVVNSIPSN